MNARIQRLRAEVASDVAAFRMRIDELSAIDLARADPNEGDLARAALDLHHGYGAVESALARIARTIEGSLPEAADWHQALLGSMSLEIEGVRPQVLGAETAQLLRRLLAFRHFLRHAYSVPLDRERLARLARDACEVAPLLEGDLDRFDRFLESLAKEK